MHRKSGDAACRRSRFSVQYHRSLTFSRSLHSSLQFFLTFASPRAASTRYGTIQSSTAFFAFSGSFVIPTDFHYISDMRWIVLSAGLFTAAVFAGSLNDTPPCDSPPCISAADAQEVADHFEPLISNYSNASATAFLTTNFTDYSSGVNSLINGGCADGPVDLDNPTFTSLIGFEAGQGSQPNIPFE